MRRGDKYNIKKGCWGDAGSGVDERRMGDDEIEGIEMEEEDEGRRRGDEREISI